MNKEEATKEATRREEKALKRFCPLIKNFCRKDCASFNEATINETKFYNEPPTGIYNVMGGYCMSPLIWKEEQQ